MTCLVHRRCCCCRRHPRHWPASDSKEPEDQALISTSTWGAPIYCWGSAPGTPRWHKRIQCEEVTCSQAVGSPSTSAFRAWAGAVLVQNAIERHGSQPSRTWIQVQKRLRVLQEGLSCIRRRCAARQTGAGHRLPGSTRDFLGSCRNGGPQRAAGRALHSAQQALEQRAMVGKPAGP